MGGVAEIEQLRKLIQIKEQENRDMRKLDLFFEGKAAIQEE